MAGELLSAHSTFFLGQKGASLLAQLVKNLPAMQETLVQFLNQKNPLD